MKKIFLSVFALATIGAFTTSCSSDSNSSDDKSEIHNDNPGNGGGSTNPGNGGGGTNPGNGGGGTNPGNGGGGTNPGNGGGGTNPGNGGGTPSNDAKFVHKVIIEDVTGTWCGWCPRVAEAIVRVKDHPKGSFVIPVAIHGNDSMAIPSILNPFGTRFQVTGFPFALINRSAKWEGDQPNNKSAVLNKIQNDSPIGIKISSNLNVDGSNGSGSGTVTASFKFSQGYENLKYVVYVLEKGIVKQNDPQHNYTSYFGGGSTLPNFVHNDVVRAVSGSVLGNDLGTVSSGQEVVKDNQQVAYNLFTKNLQNVEIVVFVTDASGKVLNAQVAHANETDRKSVV